MSIITDNILVNSENDMNLVNFQGFSNYRNNIAKLRLNSEMIDARFLTNLVYEDMNSEYKKFMQLSKSYYRNRMAVDKKVRPGYSNTGELFTLINGNIAKSNYKIPHAFPKLLINNKVNYMVSNPITVDIEDERLNNFWNDEIDIKKFNSKIFQVLMDAGKCGVGWLYVYLDELGKFRFENVDPIEIIPVYKANNQNELESVVRYFAIGYDMKTILKVEWWGPYGVQTFYLEEVAFEERNMDLHLNSNIAPTEIVTRTNNKSRIGISNLINPLPKEKFGAMIFARTELDIFGTEDEKAHIVETTKNENGEKEVTKRYNWEIIPFIPFYNNDEKLPEINWIKELIDAYNDVASMAMDSRVSFQEIIYVIKNYGAQNLGQFVNNLKLYNAVQLSKDGDLDIKRGEIPTEADKVTLERLKKDIFLFGQNVDLSSEEFAGNKSGVALQFLYSGLEMNANMTEMFAYEGLETFFYLFQRYIQIKISSGKINVEGKTEEIFKNMAKFTFNESMIKDYETIIRMLNESYGRISDRTYLSKHPYVDDVDKEMDDVDKDLNRRMEEVDKKMMNEEEPTENITK